MSISKFSSIPSDLDRYPPEEKFFWLLLYAPDKHGQFHTRLKGNLWLQKDVFLMTKAIRSLRDLKFDEHYLGPFSPVLESIQVQHANSGMIKQPFDKSGPISLTDKGLQLAKQIWETSSEEEKKTVTSIKQLLNEMDTWELIAYIYSSYPETTTNSDVVPDFQKTRLQSAIQLFEKSLVSLERASTIAGMSIEDFEKVLRSKNIDLPRNDVSDFRQDLKNLEHLT